MRSRCLMCANALAAFAGWKNLRAGGTGEASLETVMSYRLKHYSTLTVNGRATFMRSRENFKKEQPRRLLLFCFVLVFFPLPDCSKCLSVGLQVSFRAAPERGRRLAEISCASPWCLGPLRPRQRGSSAPSGGSACGGEALGRPPAAPLGPGQSLPAVWGCSGLVFTFSRPGSPGSKVAPDRDDNLD